MKKKRLTFGTILFVMALFSGVVSAGCQVCIADFLGSAFCYDPLSRNPIPGGGGTPTPTPTPTPNWTLIFELRLGRFAYWDSGCSDAADPITLVVRMVQNPLPHFYDHGLPVDVNHDTGTQYYAYIDNPNQYFKDSGGCERNEIDQASNNGYELCWELPPICNTSRWHARGHQDSLSDPQYQGTHDFAMTPHYDEAVSCGHAVPGDWYNNNTDWSGFSEARDRLILAWLSSGHHMMIASQFWDNRDFKEQCNGVLARADGYVYHIGQCGEIPSIPC